MYVRSVFVVVNTIVSCVKHWQSSCVEVELQNALGSVWQLVSFHPEAIATWQAISINCRLVPFLELGKEFVTSR